MVDYELVLLDMNIPCSDGIETCRRIRRSYSRLPISMLTVRDSEDDKVHALDAGADDCITKPFLIRELTARIRSAIRRFRVPKVPQEEPLTVGRVTLDLARRTVDKAGAPIRLTPREFNALRILMDNAGKPLTHDAPIATLWGSEMSVSRENLRVLISNLRAKPEDDAAGPVYLLAESQVGYRFRNSSPQ
jgi:two-component system KDP operon response regulator KdpE